MPLLILGCLGLFFPRVVIILLVILTDYIGHAYASFIWPLLGFFFAPFTTLAYAVCVNQGGGLQGGWIALFVVGILLDLGAIGGGTKSRRAFRS